MRQLLNSTCSALLYCTLLYSTLLYTASTLLNSTLPTLLYSILLYSTLFSEECDYVELIDSIIADAKTVD